MFGNNPFELPTNTDLEKVLKKNFDTINPVEMKEIKGADGSKKLFPFWTPVKDAGGTTFTDVSSFLSGKEKALDIKDKKDNVGVVQPKDAGKTYEDVSLLDKISNLINSHNGSQPFDNSGAVKAISEKMDNTSTDKVVTDNNAGEAKEVKVEKSADAKTGVGAVTPKSENMPTKTAKPETTNVVGEPKATVEKAAKAKVGKGEKGNMGAVKPQDGMGKQNMPDMTKGSEKAKGGNVGAVKPTSETKANPTDINFDKYKTDQIKKSPFKK